ncbi:hypothetical protein SOVF_104870 [Spinacia oleracea]|nr:hypothetical protein SOVF_104870 [Spinacia oleracea]
MSLWCIGKVTVRSSSHPPFYKRGGSPAGCIPFLRGKSIFSSSSSPTT